jgi:hypothetical protein
MKRKKQKPRQQPLRDRVAQLEQQVVELRTLVNRPVDVSEAMDDLIGNRWSRVMRQQLSALEQRLVFALEHRPAHRRSRP